MAAIDRKRREYRKDAIIEIGAKACARERIEFVETDDTNPVALERGEERATQTLHLPVERTA